jgi:replicative DNA helicase
MHEKNVCEAGVRFDALPNHGTKEFFDSCPCFSREATGCDKAQYRTPEEIAADAVREIGHVSGRSNSQSAMTMREIGKIWFNELNRRYNGEAHGLITPWSEFNRLTGGLNPGDLMILAGRPGMGKSAGAINVALAWAMAKKTTMYFSLEMTKSAVYNRCAAALESIPLSWLKDPASEGDYWAKASNACSRLKTEHFIVDDESGISWEQIKARAERQDMRTKLSAILIDHAHVVKLAGKTFQYPIYANTWDERMAEVDRVLAEQRMTRDDIVSITYQSY